MVIDAKPVAKAAAQPPRYSVRFQNGVWVIFDRINFAPCEVVRPNTKKAADGLLNRP